MSFNMEALLFPGLFLLLCALCGALALIDLRHGIIPDGMNLAIAAIGLGRAIVTGGALGGLDAIRDPINAMPVLTGFSVRIEKCAPLDAAATHEH